MIPTEPVRYDGMRVRADVQFLANAWAFAWRLAIWIAFGSALLRLAGF